MVSDLERAGDFGHPVVQRHVAGCVLSSPGQPDNASDRVRQPASALGDGDVLGPAVADESFRVVGFVLEFIRSCQIIRVGEGTCLEGFPQVELAALVFVPRELYNIGKR